jgi:hypothetical protein
LTAAAATLEAAAKQQTVAATLEAAAKQQTAAATLEAPARANAVNKICLRC